jgi:pimeloyl-ACP methyl ester carboxylesterase
MRAPTTNYIDDSTFHADVQYLESLWHRIPVGSVDLPVIDIGAGEPLVFVPILEHLEFVYARQVRFFSQSRRVILYRRREDRRRFVSLAERAEELLTVLDALGLQKVDLVGHGDAAMVLFEFALRHPERCRSLTIIAQAADYEIAPHPFIWLLHELFLRLPAEHVLPSWFLRRIVINYIMSSRESDAQNADFPAQLPRHLIEEQFHKIALWPAVYKFSVLPIIHSFDIRSRLNGLTMPILLINRADDRLSPETKTRWLAANIPNCTGYYVLPGKERFFMYAQADAVNSIMEKFLARQHQPLLQPDT